MNWLHVFILLEAIGACWYGFEAEWPARLAGFRWVLAGYLSYLVVWCLGLYVLHGWGAAPTPMQAVVAVVVGVLFVQCRRLYHAGQ